MTMLLVLRPEPGATATAALAAGLGLTAIASPLFTVEAIAWTPPAASGYDALMLTSANAVRHAGPALADYAALPVYAVGAATADAARAAGLDVDWIGDGDAAALLAALAADGVARVLHLCGAEHRGQRHDAIAIDRVVVYRADSVAILSEAARAALDGGAVAIVHSPRAAGLFVAHVDAAGLRREAIRVVAISPAAAIALGQGWRFVAVAPQPTDRALLAVAAALCEERAAKRRGEGA